MKKQIFQKGVDSMSGSAIVMLIFACVVLYGGLFVTVKRAMKSKEKKKE
jgi:hypothetical protein